MKHIKDEPFLDRKGAQVVVLFADGDVEVTTGWLLKLVLNQYAPTPAITLGVPEIRKYNKVLDILDAGPEDCGCFVFEDDDFAIMKKLVLAIMPTILLQPILRNAPELEDILVEAVSNHKDQES
jgi:hypothetical protein